MNFTLSVDSFYAVYNTYLIRDILDMNWLQYLGLDNSVKISVHKLKHQVDVLIVSCSNDIQQLYHILV